MTNTTPILTIDTNDLRDMIAEVNTYQLSKNHMDTLCKKSMAQKGRTPTYDALNVARCEVSTQLDRNVEMTRRLGGLLLIGGAA